MEYLSTQTYNIHSKGTLAKRIDTVLTTKKINEHTYEAEIESFCTGVFIFIPLAFLQVESLKLCGRT